MSLIESSFAKKLHLPSRTQIVNISGLGSTTCTKSGEILDIQISSLISPSASFNVSCSIINQITNNLPKFSISPEALKLPEHIKVELADLSFFKTIDPTLHLLLHLFSVILVLLEQVLLTDLFLFLYWLQVHGPSSN